MRFSRTFLSFYLIFSGLVLTSASNAAYNGTLLNYQFPSEFNLINGESIKADLIVSVKNTGDQRWAACVVQNFPYGETNYASYRIDVIDWSWQPNSEHSFHKIYHVYPGETDTTANTLSDLPIKVGEYSFTIKAEYHSTECSENYKQMNNTPIVVTFEIVSIGSISGHITDLKGSPLPNVAVLAHADINRTTLLGKGTTDQDGNYTIARVKSGSAFVSAEIDGTTFWYDGQVGTKNPLTAVEVVVMAGKNTEKVNIGAKRNFMPWIYLLLLDN